MTTPKLDDEDVRLLCLWAWRHAKDRDSFATRHVLKLVRDNEHLFSLRDLEEFGLLGIRDVTPTEAIADT
jgi:hypothetical protein